MAHQPHRRAALVAVLLLAFLAGGTLSATAAAASPRDPSPTPTGAPPAARADEEGKSRKAEDTDKHDGKDDGKDKAGRPGRSPSPSPDRDPAAAPVLGPTAPAKPHRKPKRAGKTAAPTPIQGGPAGQPAQAPVQVPPARPPAAAPTGAVARQLAVRSLGRSPFLRTALPVRPLTRPHSVVRRGPLWRVHDPADRPLLRAVRTVAGDPTTPLVVLGLVALFLLVQHRIDRSDPKLSRGHHEDPPDLRFGPALTLRTAL